jgi:hypothetical protein
MRFQQYIIDEAGGEESGKMEIHKMNIKQALDFASKKNFDISDIPGFEEHFEAAKDKAKKGWTKRVDMPVIETEDVRKLQARLKKGNIDINKPFADETSVKNPFPEGLSGLSAQSFLENGLKDGSIKDDQIDVNITKVKVNELKPIQKQIYFDKSMGSTIENGVKGSMNFIKNKSFFIISKDKYIIDGHHRFLSAMLIDPSIQVNALMIDLPLKKLLPLTKSYGDAIGNKRNA